MLWHDRCISKDEVLASRYRRSCSCPRVEDSLQKVHETVRATDILWQALWVIASKLPASHLTDRQRLWRRIRPAPAGGRANSRPQALLCNTS